MATTIIEVIDTAIKIGLGGLLTIIGTNLKYKNDYKNERKKRFFNALEDITNMIEEATHVGLKYWTFLSLYANSDIETKNSNEKFKNIEDEYYHTFKNLTITESKLLLFSLPNQAKLIREYANALNEIHIMYRSNTQISELDIENVRKNIITKRQELLNALSIIYKES